MIADSKLHRKAYSDFCSIRDRHENASDLVFLDYEAFKLSDRPVFSNAPLKYFFVNHAEGFAREILNEIHNLRRYLEDLRCWLQVLGAYTEDERFDLIIEFIDDRTVLALGRPAATKARFIYAATKVGVEFARVKVAEELPEERKIAAKEMKKWIGGWAGFPDFDRDLNEIEAAAYNTSVSNFRNLDAHRFPPRIEVGLAPAEGIFPTGDKVSYSLDHHQPLKLDDINRLLTKEYSLMVKTSYSFWAMLTKQVEVW